MAWRRHRRRNSVGVAQSGVSGVWRRCGIKASIEKHQPRQSLKNIIAGSSNLAWREISGGDNRRAWRKSAYRRESGGSK